MPLETSTGYRTAAVDMAEEHVSGVSGAAMLNVRGKCGSFGPQKNIVGGSADMVMDGRSRFKG
jgi:hypothetical protein